ncbi:V-type ATP synthase subunit F [Magnetovibrio sp.]|uniref:V-type ATP synthase subunit F n=1 Tax=Magnetovibrio sp. TaxID=2024836 RepID=UPI002F956418
MSRVAFIGDEISAAGYRLAGAEIFCPGPGQTHQTFAKVSASADVIMITAEAAGSIPAAVMAEAQAASTPLVMIVEDIRARMSPPDLEKQMHAILGLDA